MSQHYGCFMLSSRKAFYSGRQTNIDFESITFPEIDGLGMKS